MRQYFETDSLISSLENLTVTQAMKSYENDQAKVWIHILDYITFGIFKVVQG